MQGKYYEARATEIDPERRVLTCEVVGQGDSKRSMLPDRRLCTLAHVLCVLCCTCWRWAFAAWGRAQEHWPLSAFS